MIKDFKIVSKLGEGAYSSVYKVERVTDGQTYALKRVKMLNLKEKEKENSLNEVRILASLRDPNVIMYKEAFFEERTNSLCIVMEYCDGGDLYQKITKQKKKKRYFKESEIWDVLIQLIKGLNVLHERKILHRDLKSANVFVNKDGQVKLGDMNVSKLAKMGLLYTQTGTPYYASPEVWKDQPYDHKSDIWSLGCVIYEFVCLKPPFRADDMEGLYKSVQRGNYDKVPGSFSQDLAHILRAMLTVKAKHRPDCKTLLQMPCIVKRINENHLQVLDDPEELNKEMLNTINIPKNLKFLSGTLPKPNYEPLKLRMMDKRNFLKTLQVGHHLLTTNQSPRDRDFKSHSLPRIKHNTTSETEPSFMENQLVAKEEEITNMKKKEKSSRKAKEKENEQREPKIVRRKQKKPIKQKSPMKIKKSVISGLNLNMLKKKKKKGMSSGRKQSIPMNSKNQTGNLGMFEDNHILFEKYIKRKEDSYLQSKYKIRSKKNVRSQRLREKTKPRLPSLSIKSQYFIPPAKLTSLKLKNVKHLKEIKRLYN